MENNQKKESRDLVSETKTSLISRNITVLGKRTSIRLEPEMWLALKEISMREHCTIHDICTLVNVRKNPRSSLTAAIRAFLMLYFRAASTEEGHVRAGHGNFQSMMQRARIPAQSIPGMNRRRVIRPPSIPHVEMARASVEGVF